jgi:hypothetical protein
VSNDLGMIMIVVNHMDFSMWAQEESSNLGSLTATSLSFARASPTTLALVQRQQQLVANILYCLALASYQLSDWSAVPVARRGHRTGPAARHTVIRRLRAWCQAAGKEHTQ